MARGTLETRRSPLRDLFVDGTTVGLSDGELLRRYADTRDGTAFEALVSRHGSMVAATCRAVLLDHHDVEDAFQVTFLVLARRAASIRALETLGGWLHRVAYRAALRLNAQARRRRKLESDAEPMEIPDTARPPLDFDMRSILHQEIDRLPDRERWPVVLCDLEGLTYEQAAGRLRWTVPSLYHRLARGRSRLRNRPIRRGVTVAATGIAAELSRCPAMAAVPMAWSRAAVAAATGGPVHPAVAVMTHELIRSLIVTRIKIASIVLTMTALASVAVVMLRTSGPIATAPVSPKSARPVSEIPTVPPRPGTLRIGRLMYDGNRNTAPNAIPNLMAALREPPLRYEVVLRQKDLSPRDPGLVYYPLLHIHGLGDLSFPAEELDALRRHLDPGGGTLLADAARGDPRFDASFRRFVAVLLPDHRLVPIPADDELYTEKVGFDLRNCRRTRAAGGGQGLPQLEGAKVGEHWAIIYSKLDLGHALEGRSEDDFPAYTHDSAVRIVGNILTYSIFD